MGDLRLLDLKSYNAFANGTADFGLANNDEVDVKEEEEEVDKDDDVKKVQSLCISCISHS